MREKLTNIVICLVAAIVLFFSGRQVVLQNSSVSFAESKESNVVTEQITSSAGSVQRATTAISWEQNGDGSYTFTMGWQGENSKYAWYVLDGANEPYVKTKYSEDNTYTYDLLSDGKAKTIKCFVRKYTGEEYEQNTYKVSCEEIRTAQSAVSQKETATPEITWEKNADGSYTFAMGWQGENSKYAWYVLDNANEPYVKTKYSEDNTYTYDLLSDGKAKTIKCFVRKYTGEEYEQNTYKVSCEEIRTTQNIVSQIKTEIPEITWEKNADGSYTFTMGWQGENSEYAWYVLDSSDEPYLKTKYSKENTFTYDLLSDEKGKTIKCFVRIYTGNEYTQTSYRLERLLIEKEIDELEVSKYNISLIASEREKNALKQIILNDRKTDVLAQDVLNGIIFDHTVSFPFDWNCPWTTSRNNAYTITSMHFLSDVFATWNENGSEECKKIIEKYVLDFANQTQIVRDDNNIIWHDDATARRVHRMSVFYDLFKYDYRDEEKEIIKKSLHDQAMLLLDDTFYTWNHNHGMYQDIGVIAYALLICEDPVEKETMIKTAVARTAQYIEYVYTSDGVHKEHSPRYALDVIEGIKRLQEIMTDICPEFVLKISRYLSANISFLIQDIEPDGTLPSVGDNAKKYNNIIKKEEFDNSEEALWIRSGGKEGTRPQEVSVYPEGGYAFFRSSWDDAPDKATWLMFIAATHSSTHKHGDDLSFLLYHKGDLFVEAGSRDYNYLNPQTFWAYSGYAHNVLLVDGKAFPVNVGTSGWQSILPDALKTHITEYEVTDENNYTVSGSCERFLGILWKRTINYDKSAGKVQLKDCVSGGEHKGTLIYHIAEGIEVKENNTGWDLLRDGILLASVEIKITEGEPILRTYRGEGEEPFYTWIFNGKTDPVYGTVLIIDFDIDNKESNVITEIQLY